MKRLFHLLILMMLISESMAADSNSKRLDVSVQGAGLQVVPTQVIFTPESQKIVTIYLSNNSNKVNTYRLKIVHYKMTEDGKFKEIDIKKEKIEYALNRKIRFSPRQVTIAPKTTQVVKVMLRGVKNLKGHEYRSRLAFITIPNLKKQEENARVEKIGFNLVGLFGISIPVMYWPENTSSSLKIEDLKTEVKEDGALVKFLALRTGNVSNYSDLIFYFKKGAVKEKVYEMKRHYIYYPLERVKREVMIKNLTESQKEQLKKGNARIEIEVKPIDLKI